MHPDASLPEEDLQFAAAVAQTPHALQVAIDQLMVERFGLRKFIELAWHTVEGGAHYSSNWHIDAITEHLEAVSAGQIKRLIIAVPPRSMKPVHEDEMVVLEDRGRVRLSEVRVGDRILTHKGRFRLVSAVHDNGVLPTVRLNTWEQRSVRMAPDHPVLTTEGWAPCGTLTKGEVVGVVPPGEPHGRIGMSAEEARLLGYLVGDGSIKYNAVVLTNADPATLVDMQACAEAMGWRCGSKLDLGKRATRLNISPLPVGQAWSAKKGDHPVWSWLVRHGLRNTSSYTKRVPASVMQGDLNTVRQFLGAYWSCDGLFSNKSAVNPTDGYKRLHIEATATTVGRELAGDLQHLLLRLGIQARVRRRERPNKSKRQEGDTYVYYNVTVSDVSGVAKFARVVPMVHARFARVAPLGLRQAEFDRPIWGDEVVSVEPDEPGRCLCLTVEEDHSFTAGDVAVHNSVSVAVMWPAWDWIKNPSRRFLFASYAQNLSIRDSARCRRVIQSPWYQDRFRDRFRITSDQNTKQRFDNDKTGYRLSTSVGGSLTGEGGGVVVVDDPLNSSDSDSVAVRESMLQWWNESMSTRLNDPANGAFVIIQQRLHERDLIGDVIKKHGLVQHGGDYVYLMLPAEYEPDHPHRWFRDPRTELGQLLWPSHVPRHVLENLKKSLGNYSAAGQLQQRPAPREGGIFKLGWFPRTKVLPPDLTYARGWDLAASEKKTVSSDPDWTATVKIGFSRSQRRWYIVDIRRWRENPAEIERLIKAVADEDAAIGHEVRISLPKDPGQAGVAQSKSMLAMLSGYDVQAEPQSGDKMTRAMPLASQASGGNVSMLSADWNDDFLAEITGFPTAAHDDQVDAAASAFTRLTGGSSGLIEYYQQQLDQIEAEKARVAAALAANGGTLPALLVIEEDTTDLARALTMAGKAPTF